jgi:hypothetical protein
MSEDEREAARQSIPPATMHRTSIKLPALMRRSAARSCRRTGPILTPSGGKLNGALKFTIAGAAVGFFFTASPNRVAGLWYTRYHDAWLSRSTSRGSTPARPIATSPMRR